jgi:hypothetical protein
MSTRFLGLVAVLLAISVGLAATNPGTDDYQTFVQGLFGQALDRMDSSDWLQRVLKSQGKQLVPAVVRPNTVRHNYGLFSIFETHVFEVRVVVLGIGNSFIPIDGLEELTRKLGRLGRQPDH